MKKYIFIFLFLSITFHCIGQTIVPKVIDKSIVWKKANSPYIVNNTVIVYSRVTITIEAGAIVHFNDYGQILLFGNIIAKGKSQDSVHMISNAGILKAEEFKSIQVFSGGTVTLNYCRVDKHFNFIEASGSADSIFVKHSLFTNNIYTFSGKLAYLDIDSCKFLKNTYCIAKMDIDVRNSVFQSNGVGFEAVIGKIYNCKIENNTNAGILITSKIALVNNDFWGNKIGFQYKSESEKNLLLNNRFIENEIGIQLIGSSIPVDSMNNNSFCKNIIAVENLTNLNFDFSNNCWCTTNNDSINSFISNKSEGTVNFQPLNLACRSCKPLPYAVTDTVCNNIPFELKVNNVLDTINDVYNWTASKDSILIARVNYAEAVAVANNTSDSLLLSQFKVILQNPSCKDSAFVPVWIYPNSESKCRKCLINGGKDKIVCSNTNIILGNKTESTFQTFKWYPSDGLNYDTLEMPVFNKENKTDQAIILNYIITAEDSMINCIVSDTIQVTLLSEFFVDCNGIPYIHVYNTITPNGDSENESFTIDNIEFYPDNEVSVYNRWGNKVMNRKGYKNDWNGGSLPDGIYYYVVILKNVGQHYKGDLTIKN